MRHKARMTNPSARPQARIKSKNMLLLPNVSSLITNLPIRPDYPTLNSCELEHSNFNQMITVAENRMATSMYSN
jgi:hypothetical protein